MISKRQGLAILLVAGAASAGAWLVWSQRADAHERFAEARKALEDGEVERAEQTATELEHKGHAAHARVLRAALWLHEGRTLLDRLQASEHSAQKALSVHSRSQQAFQLALAELTQTQAEDPLAVEATLIGAECLIRTGEHRLPAEALGAMLRRVPDNLQAHRLLTAIYMETGARDDAIRHYREWARLDPADGRPFRWIGFLYKGQNKFGEAAQAYDEASKRELVVGVRAEVLREWAETLIEGQAAFESAFEVLARCPEPFASTPEIHILQAECLSGLNRTPEATKLVEAVLRKRPNMPRALALRALLYLAEDQPAAAAPLLESALKQDAHDIGNRQLLIQAYQRLGRPGDQFVAQAKVEEQRKLMEATRKTKDQLTRLHGLATLRPWDDQLRYEIAELSRQIDRPNEARMWLRASLAINRNHAKARALLEQLAPQEVRPPIIQEP